ncbi:MAG: DUF1343 domain-containing protein, partial [Calditrichaeota bacterium]|nr:DUF1343 domain-containing protein [Calditrichota bacterium]MCB0316486.1 DUF1343 domain-containing protein [Calditrichota bacterium]
MNKVKPMFFYLLFTIVMLLLTASVVLKQSVNQESHPDEKMVVLGVENFLRNHLNLVKGKKVGLITNPSGVDRYLNSTAD